MSVGKGQDGTGRAAGRQAGETKLEGSRGRWGAGSADDKTEGEGETPREVEGSDRLDHSCIFSPKRQLCSNSNVGNVLKQVQTGS